MACIVVDELRATGLEPEIAVGGLCVRLFLDQELCSDSLQSPPVTTKLERPTPPPHPGKARVISPAGSHPAEEQRRPVVNWDQTITLHVFDVEAVVNVELVDSHGGILGSGAVLLTQLQRNVHQERKVPMAASSHNPSIVGHIMGRFTLTWPSNVTLRGQNIDIPSRIQDDVTKMSQQIGVGVVLVKPKGRGGVSQQPAIIGGIEEGGGLYLSKQVKLNDAIIQVEYTPTMGLSLREISQLLEGPPFSLVSIIVARVPGLESGNFSQRIASSNAVSAQLTTMVPREQCLTAPVRTFDLDGPDVTHHVITIVRVHPDASRSFSQGTNSDADRGTEDIGARVQSVPNHNHSESVEIQQNNGSSNQSVTKTSSLDSDLNQSSQSRNAPSGGFVKTKAAKSVKRATDPKSLSHASTSASSRSPLRTRAMKRSASAVADQAERNSNSTHENRPVRSASFQNDQYVSAVDVSDQTPENCGLQSKTSAIDGAKPTNAASAQHENVKLNSSILARQIVSDESSPPSSHSKVLGFRSFNSANTHGKYTETPDSQQTTSAQQAELSQPKNVLVSRVQDKYERKNDFDRKAAGSEAQKFKAFNGSRLSKNTHFSSHGSSVSKSKLTPRISRPVFPTTDIEARAERLEDLLSQQANATAKLDKEKEHLVEQLERKKQEVGLKDSAIKSLRLENKEMETELKQSIYKFNRIEAKYDALMAEKQQLAGRSDHIPQLITLKHQRDWMLAVVCKYEAAAQAMLSALPDKLNESDFSVGSSEAPSAAIMWKRLQKCLTSMAAVDIPNNPEHMDVSFRYQIQNAAKKIARAASQPKNHSSLPSGHIDDGAERAVEHLSRVLDGALASKHGLQDASFHSTVQISAGTQRSVGSSSLSLSPGQDGDNVSKSPAVEHEKGQGITYESAETSTGVQSSNESKAELGMNQVLHAVADTSARVAELQNENRKLKVENERLRQFRSIQTKTIKSQRREIDGLAKQLAAAKRATSVTPDPSLPDSPSTRGQGFVMHSAADLRRETGFDADSGRGNSARVSVTSADSRRGISLSTSIAQNFHSVEMSASPRDLKGRSSTSPPAVQVGRSGPVVEDFHTSPFAHADQDPSSIAGNDVFLASTKSHAHNSTFQDSSALQHMKSRVDSLMAEVRSLRANLVEKDAALAERTEEVLLLSNAWKSESSRSQSQSRPVLNSSEASLSPKKSPSRSAPSRMGLAGSVSVSYSPRKQQNRSTIKASGDYLHDGLSPAKPPMASSPVRAPGQQLLTSSFNKH